MWVAIVSFSFVFEAPFRKKGKKGSYQKKKKKGKKAYNFLLIACLFSSVAKKL